MEKKLEVKHLTISFRTDAGKVQAVRDISFDLYKGETLAIVGESGSGKSVTNKAIIGISAGNAIIEKGEILYEGKDLLQISEDEFHRLRGDKIAMIFQDPLSALNPIVRIGTQLTEAMILKNRAARREGRREFNKMMRNLLAAMNVGKSPEECQQNALKCKQFNKFEVHHLKLEAAYQRAFQAATVCSGNASDVLFLLGKGLDHGFENSLRVLKSNVRRTVHRYVCPPEIVDKTLNVVALLKAGLKSKDFAPVMEPLKEIVDIFKKGAEAEMPNYFAWAYCQVFGNPQDEDYLSAEQIDSMSVPELNAIIHSYLDNHFMLDFIEHAKGGIEYSRNLSNERKQAVIQAVQEARPLYDEGTPDKKLYIAKAKELAKIVESSIDPLQLVKDSKAFTFRSSLIKAIRAYFAAIPSNAKEQKRYDKEMVKYNKIIERGKTPDYKVVPAKIVDLEVARHNIVHILNNMERHYNKLLEEKEFDLDAAAVAMIDYLKSKAQEVAYHVTPGMAKERALSLMEEVGIPEPRRRYRQYPFEFSGGMRQRIVIAIALAANPDILICDEPTTALDVTIQSQILELINKIKAERHLSIIFITHDLGVVANMADRVAVMYAGKIVEMGTAEDIFYSPAHPYTWALLSSMPDLDTNEKLDAIPGTPPNMIYPPKGDAFAARNKYAMQIDFEEQPPMFRISDTHQAATWLLHPDAPKVDPPKQVTDRIERMKRVNAKLKQEGGQDNE